jgi:hypothetical protein
MEEDIKVGDIVRIKAGMADYNYNHHPSVVDSCGEKINFGHYFGNHKTVTFKVLDIVITRGGSHMVLGEVDGGYVSFSFKALMRDRTINPLKAIKKHKMYE